MARKLKAKLTVDGLESVLKRMRSLPPKMQRAVLRPATTKASTPVVRIAKKLIPIGDGLKPDGNSRPHLKDTIKKTRAKMGRNGSVYVIAGPEANKAPHDHLVEFGTKPHDITLGKAVTLNGGVTLPEGFTIKHPGSKALNYMSQASDVARPQSTEIMRKSILQGIDKQVAKLAKAGR